MCSCLCTSACLYVFLEWLFIFGCVSEWMFVSFSAVVFSVFVTVCVWWCLFVSIFACLCLCGCVYYVVLFLLHIHVHFFKSLLSTAYLKQNIPWYLEVSLLSLDIFGVIYQVCGDKVSNHIRWGERVAIMILTDST